MKQSDESYVLSTDSVPCQFVLLAVPVAPSPCLSLRGTNSAPYASFNRWNNRWSCHAPAISR